MANLNTIVAATSGEEGFVLPPLEVRAKIKGAMWTARAPVGFGPRPYQTDNCICIDYFEMFPQNERETIIDEYVHKRSYTHTPMGPIVDPGYHGQLPEVDWRNDPTPYFDAAQQLQEAGCQVIHFLRPDRDVSGLAWTVQDLQQELNPIFESQRAQDLMGIVCLGWEPGPIYYYNNQWWVEMCQWMDRTFPRALRLIHMVSDCDAPVGQDDDLKGISNGQGWANVAPYIHGYLAQYGGYVSQDNPVPSDDFKNEFGKAIRRLKAGFTEGVGGWPIFSAWGSNQGIKAYAGEYAAFGDYWKNFPESYAVELGNLAMANGADGYFDGGSVNV